MSTKADGIAALQRLITMFGPLAEIKDDLDVIASLDQAVAERKSELQRVEGAVAAGEEKVKQLQQDATAAAARVDADTIKAKEEAMRIVAAAQAEATTIVADAKAALKRADDSAAAARKLMAEALDKGREIEAQRSKVAAEERASIARIEDARKQIGDIAKAV